MSLLRDLRYALRMLAKAPVFSAVAVSLLAVGMAAAPAVFSFANALFWKPLDAPHHDRIVRLFIRTRGETGGEFSYPEYRELRDHASAFDALAAEYPSAPLNLVADNDSREENGAVVSANYFDLLGVKPLLGRFFRPDEDQVPDRDPVAVISARLWRRRFAAEPSTLGREISINGVAFRVIGIAPENFFGDQPGIAASELWIPTAMLRAGYRWCDAYSDANCTVLDVVGRLKPGSSAAAAEAEANSIAAAEHWPASRDGNRIVALPATGVHPQQKADLAPQLRLLMAIALVLLLVACANVAGMLLARGVTRRREIAVRRALGARASRIVAQLLTENLVLAVLGAAGGVLLGWWIRDGFVSLYTLQGEGGNAFYDVRTDWRTVAFALAAALATGLLFGILPALRAVHGDLTEDLKAGGGAIGSQRGGRLRDFLAAAQVGLSLVLLVAAGLMTRSAHAILSGVNFDPDHVVVLRLRPRLVQYTPAQAESFYRAVAQRLPSLPQVEATGYAVGGIGFVWRTPTGSLMRPGNAPQRDVSVRVLPVNPEFFSALRIPLLQGRVFTDQDQPGAPPVLVVNRAAARQYWPSASALGQVLVLNGEAYRVVGVVADIGLRSVGESPAPQLYSSFWQSHPGAQGDVRMAVRVRGDSHPSASKPALGTPDEGAALDSIRHAIASVDPRVPIAEDMPLAEQIKSSYAGVWLARSVTVWCGLVALLLSAVGLYSVLAFAVRSRTREIGVRVALGARPSDIVGLVVGRALLICAAGTAAGLLLALSTWRLLASLIYGVSAFDLFSFVAAPVALSLVAIAASYLPARRAARIDAMAALRCD